MRLETAITEQTAMFQTVLSAINGLTIALREATVGRPPSQPPAASGGTPAAQGPAQGAPRPSAATPGALDVITKVPDDLCKQLEKVAIEHEKPHAR